MVLFIDVHRDAYGVEPICRLLQIAPQLDLGELLGLTMSLTTNLANLHEDIGLDLTPDRRVYNANFNSYDDPFPAINYTEKNTREDTEDLNGNTVLEPGETWQHTPTCR